MGRRVIDLSLTIRSANYFTQWPKRLVGQYEPITRIDSWKDPGTNWQGRILYTRFEMASQSYTHIDAPSHFYEEGISNDQLPLERLVGEAVVLDMLHKKPGEGVSAKDLEASSVEVRPGDIAIIRTGWSDEAFGTERYWVEGEMKYLERDVADWLVSKKVNALVSDCYVEPPPFYRCTHCKLLHIRERASSPNHMKLLKNGIPLISHCTNLKAIRKERVFLVGLPIKLQGTDGAPARVIAIEED